MPTDTSGPGRPSSDLGPPGRRAMILRLLRSSSAPRSVASLAEELEVHPNTARFHLDALIEAGRVERVLAPTQGPGRPPVGYRLRAGMDRSGPTNYRLLAAMLTGYLAQNAGDPAQAATELGRSWGPALLDQAERAGSTRSAAGGRVRVSKSEALARAVDVLADLGFEPEPVTSSRTSEIRLRHCPFLDLVDEHAEVICSLHLGLMQGALAALRGPVTVDRLDPFVQPDLCVAHLAGASR